RSDRFVLASGTGAKLARESGVLDAEFIVAVDVTAGTGPTGEALIRLATGIERDWLTATAAQTRHELDEATGSVRAFREQRYESLIVAQSPIAPDSSEAAALVSAAYARRGPT